MDPIILALAKKYTDKKTSEISSGAKPEKGVDYFTEEDKTELVNSVLDSLPTWTGGSY